MHAFTNSLPMMNDFLFYIFQDKLGLMHQEEFFSCIVSFVFFCLYTLR